MPFTVRLHSKIVAPVLTIDLAFFDQFKQSPYRGLGERRAIDAVVKFYHLDRSLCFANPIK